MFHYVNTVLNNYNTFCINSDSNNNDTLCPILNMLLQTCGTLSNNIIQLIYTNYIYQNNKQFYTLVSTYHDQNVSQNKEKTIKQYNTTQKETYNKEQKHDNSVKNGTILKRNLLIPLLTTLCQKVTDMVTQGAPTRALASPLPAPKMGQVGAGAGEKIVLHGNAELLQLDLPIVTVKLSSRSRQQNIKLLQPSVTTKTKLLTGKLCKINIICETALRSTVLLHFAIKPEKVLTIMLQKTTLPKPSCIINMVTQLDGEDRVLEAFIGLITSTTKWFHIAIRGSIKVKPMQQFDIQLFQKLSKRYQIIEKVVTI